MNILGELHGKEDDAGRELAHDAVRDLRHDILEARLVLPVAHGDADDRFRAIGVVAPEDGASCLLVDRMDGKDRVRRALDLRLRDAEPRELCKRALVAHRDEIDAVADHAHRKLREAADDRADALCVEHDLLAHDDGQEDDGEIVV